MFKLQRYKGKAFGSELSNTSQRLSLFITLLPSGVSPVYLEPILLTPHSSFFLYTKHVIVTQRCVNMFMLQR